MSNEELINDFIHGRGSFSEAAIDNYVHPDDLRAARFHHSAGSKFLELAKNEESKSESERLMQKANCHFHELDLVLRQYDC